MAEPSEEQLQIARLEARVAALEAELRERSEEIELFVEHCCERDLVILRRLRDGLPARTRYDFDPGLWRETTELTPAEVEPVLEDLWRNVSPRKPRSDAG